MIIVLHGADTYRSRKKLREIIAQYREKSGSSFAIEKFDAETDDLSLLYSMLGSGALFQKKRLVIVEYAFSVNEQVELVKQALGRASGDKDVILVLWDGVLDAEAKKRLAQVAKSIDKSQEFEELKGEKLSRWVKQEAEERGVKISAPDIARISLQGTDSWRIVQEIEKLAVGLTYTNNSAAGRDHTIFELGDTFFTSPRAALRILLTMLDRGEDEFGLFAYLASHSRTLIMVKSYLEKGVGVPTSLDIHPFVIKKASAIARTIPKEKLLHFHRQFFEADWRIKTGASTAQESLIRMLIC